MRRDPVLGLAGNRSARRAIDLQFLSQGREMVEPRTLRSNDMSEVLTKALALATAGIPVFPCAATKRPTCPHGFLDASCEPSAVRALWRNHPGPLIGVPTGFVSGLFVVDIDGPRHPEAEKWLERNAAYLPETRQHTTRSGGLHLLFKHRAGLRNTTSRLAPGVDTRGEGGYILWWPAALASSADNRSLCAVPDWWSRRLPRRRASFSRHRYGHPRTLATSGKCPG
jgi:Bifunctional DNA primase/polymerase, N-terminal